MRIDNSNRTGAGTGVRTERTRKTDRAKALLSRRAPDTLSIMDIPPNELTPKVREAIMTLMAEVDHLRQEIEEQRARVSNLERLADQDPLTPLVNRRAFVRELSRIVSFSERYGTPASLVFFDMNGLKAINDTYGHAAGDAALQRVAVVLGLEGDQRRVDWGNQPWARRVFSTSTDRIDEVRAGGMARADRRGSAKFARTWG